MHTPAFFTWTVPKAGFRWVEKPPLFSGIDGASESPGPFLSSGLAQGERHDARRYNPLSETALFHDFAEISLDEDGILEFANRYGTLGGIGAVRIGVREGSEAKSQLTGFGEPLHYWRNEIEDMRAAMHLWTLAKQSDITALSEFIEWRSGGIFYKTSNCSERIADEDEPEMLARFVPGEVILPALHIVQRRVNGKLSEHRVTPRILWDASFQRLTLHVVPESLIGCLWLHFARAIGGGREYRRCLGCNKWIEVSLEQARSDKRYCEPTCKARAHRKKIAEARNLSAQGITPKDIARRLGTDTKTVSGWVKA